VFRLPDATTKKLAFYLINTPKTVMKLRTKLSIQTITGGQVKPITLKK